MHHKLRIEPCRIWRTEGKLGLTREPVSYMGMTPSKERMRMRIRKTKRHKAKMDQHRMRRTEGIVL